MILPSLGQFWADHPGIQVSIAPEGNLTPVDLDRFDTAIRGKSTASTWPHHADRPLLSTPLTVCASPALLEREDGDLARLPWVRDKSMPDEIWRGLMTRIGISPDRIRLVDTGDAKFEVEAACMGYGVSLSAELVVRKHLRDGALLRVDTALDTTLVYRAAYARGPLADPVARFLDWLGPVAGALSFAGQTRPSRSWSPA